MFKVTMAVFLVLFAMVGSCRRAPAPVKDPGLPTVTILPPPVLTQSDRPVVLIYTDGWDLNPSAEMSRHVETAVWGDGRIAWRENSSLLEGRVDPTRIESLLQRLHQEGVFGNGKVGYVKTGPDSPFRVIRIQLADRRLLLGSWHELCGDPDTIVTSDGVGPLEGRDRNAVMAAQPAEYKRFISVWDEVRGAVRSWIPSERRPCLQEPKIGFGE